MLTITIPSVSYFEHMGKACVKGLKKIKNKGIFQYVNEFLDGVLTD